jgi:hypothetical protein
MPKLPKLSIAHKHAMSVFAICAACNSFAALPEPVAPVIPPIPTALLSANVSLDEMFGTWLRPYLVVDGFEALSYAGLSNVNQETIVQGIAKYCESHGGTTSESGKGTSTISVKCETATSLFTSFKLSVRRARAVQTFTMVDIWDDMNISFFQKARVNRFEGSNRLLVASILLDDAIGVSKAIANGADAKIMVCDTTDKLLAPVGHADCGTVVRNLLGLQLLEFRKTYTPIANALLSAGAKWPTNASYESKVIKTFSGELTDRVLYRGAPYSGTTTRAEQEAARIEYVNVWRDLVKLGLVFNFADMKDEVAKTLVDDGSDRDFKLKLLGAFANATNQKQQFDQMVAEFDGMDVASLQRKAHREIGDTVCKYERGEVSGVKGIVKTMAFVEDKTPKKLKLRIAGFSLGKWSGTKYYASNNINLSTDMMSKVNSIIFDDPINWRDDCDKVTR